MAEIVNLYKCFSPECNISVDKSDKHFKAEADGEIVLFHSRKCAEKMNIPSQILKEIN